MLDCFRFRNDESPYPARDRKASAWCGAGCALNSGESRPDQVDAHPSITGVFPLAVASTIQRPLIHRAHSVSGAPATLLCDGP